MLTHRPRAVLAVGAAMLCTFALPSLAAAHGGVSVENDMCKLRVGRYQMHFTGYQPVSAPEVEFCEDIPATGQTIIVLDYIDAELRDLPVEVRIIRDTGDESNLDAVTVYHKPAQVYPRGNLVIDHTFPERGKFVGMVTVGPDVSRFPFAVGTRGTRALVLYGAFGALALGAGAGLFLYSARRS
jgi:hypothetical protein